MPRIDDQNLLEVLLDSWDRNNTILVNLLGALPEDGLEARAMEDSPSVAQMFNHIHYVRLVFLSEDAPEFAKDVPEEWVDERDAVRLARLLTESAGAVREAVKSRVESGQDMNLHYDHPILFLQHMIWHEGYHHGQIKLALKAAGRPLTNQKVGPRRTSRSPYPHSVILSESGVPGERRVCACRGGGAKSLPRACRGDLLFLTHRGTMPLTLKKIISGGQTGVDQAALRAAASLGISIGGWCPPGRLAEDGPIPEAFPLRETPGDRSPEAPEIPRSQRTEWNARDSDGTLVLRPADLEHDDPGTLWTEQFAARYSKPILVADPTDLRALSRVRQWLEEHRIAALNIAGPSERTCPGIGGAAERFLLDLLA